MGAMVVLLGVVGLLLAPVARSLGAPADPDYLWITPPLGAAVALLLAVPRRQRPHLLQYAGLHGWALILGQLGGLGWRFLQSEAQPSGVAVYGVLLAGAVAALQSVGGWILGARHPPAHATALLVLFAPLDPAALCALAAGLWVGGALACPWRPDRS